MMLYAFSYHQHNSLAFTEERVLLLVRAGNDVNIESIWNQTGSSYPTDLDPLMTARDLIPLTLVRSTLIDDWDNPPDKIHIRTLNSQGDVLWEMAFQVPLGTGPTLRSLLIESNIISSSSPVTASTAEISWSKPSYQLHIGSTTGTDVAWLGVWDGPSGQSQNQYPVFLVPRFPDVPPTLAAETSMNAAYTYEGCWSFSAMTKIYAIEDIQGMTLLQCAFHCRALSHPRMFLEMRYKCHCGDFVSSPTGRDDSQCSLPCIGDPSNTNTCGGSSNMFATYPVPEAVSTQYVYEGCWSTVSLDSQTYLDKPYMTVTLCNSVCSPRNKALTIIQNGQSCQCGTFRSTDPNDRNDPLCVTSCPGASTFEPCGGNGMASVYLTGQGREEEN
ncbi:putative fungistatic metabolite [Pecten maximus]|uniref:putative fungistatic metabolite n=1 Tax=Pecten maximus TaxID=6579 RepID=UPI001458A21B|nr:putative fungistatic metabolite [Pecten maximus]